EPIDNLEILVTSLFGDVPNKDVPQPSWDDSPWVEAVLKPTAYVTHLLGHEGQGSLLSLLKKMGWVNRLTCGVSRPGKGFASLIISMDLTENGLGRVDDIVAKVYQYLRMLRSDEPQEWIFLENQALNNLHFRFKDKEQPYDYVMQSATNLFRWRGIECDIGMTLPASNKYIATEFNIHPRPKDFSTVAPELLVSTELSRLWFLPDHQFGFPKAFVTFHIISPVAFVNPLKTLLTALYVDLFEDLIGEDTYNCLLAGMVAEVRRTTQGIKLSFAGYSHKLGLLIRNVVDAMIHFLAPSPDRFRCMCEVISHEINNFSLKASYQQAGIYLTNVITDRSWINEELAAAFPEVTLELVSPFIQEFFAQVFIEILAYGNVTVDEAMSYRELIEGAFLMQFGSKPLSPSQITMAREVIFPTQTKAIFQRLTFNQPTSAICYYLQGPLQSTRNDTILNLFCEMIHESAFNTLRTEQQLGYIVYTGARRSNTLQGFRCIIQSSSRPDELEKQIENFLASVRDFIVFMTPKEYDMYVDSLTSRLLEQPKSMAERNARIWAEIACHHYNFERQRLEAEVLQQIPLGELLEFYDGDMIKDHNKFKDGCKLSDLAQPFIPLKPRFNAEGASFLLPTQSSTSQP
ncbi:hypothetical protein EG68_08286, partial [Paragonimus skrjabini miyazakii]